MKRSKSKLQTVCLAVLGAALCVALSMAAKIQLGGHIATIIGIITVCIGLYSASIIKHRYSNPKRGIRSVAMNAIRKLSHGVTDPSQYTKRELEVLDIIMHDKHRRTDTSLWDVHTQYGLSRLEFALSNHKIGYQYYIDKLVFNESSPMKRNDIKALCEARNLPFKADFLETLSEQELHAGYIKFNIPDMNDMDSLNGESVWGWVTPEEKKKHADSSYTGELTAILCNVPLNFYRILWYGSEVKLTCHGESCPTLSKQWVHDNIFGTEWFSRCFK